MDDHELARRLAIDPEGAFEALVTAHVDRLYSIALRLTGDRRDAEEIAQDTFVRAHRALRGYERARIAALELRPWLATIAVNLARNRRRRAADRLPPVQLDGSVAAEHATDGQPEPEALASADRERLAACLAELPERYRAPVVLRYVADLSFAEIGTVLGRPEGTLKAQVHRGLALLRAALDAADRQEMTA